MKKSLIASIVLILSVGFSGTGFANIDTSYLSEIEALKHRISDLEKPKTVVAKRDDGLNLGGDVRIRYIDDHSGDTSIQTKSSARTPKESKQKFYFL